MLYLNATYIITSSSLISSFIHITEELLGPQVDKAKQQAAAKLREQLEKAVQRLQGLIAKLQKPQQ